LDTYASQRRLQKARRLIAVRQQQLDFVTQGLVAAAHLGEVRRAGIQRQRPRALERLFETRPGFAGKGHVPRILTGRGLLRCRHFPGMPVPSTETTRDRRRVPVEVTFTKWRTAQIPPPPAVTLRSLFAGFVEGNLGVGDFVAEVLDRKVSTPCTFTAPPCTPGTTPPTITGSIASLQAIYEVQVGEHSFIALIQGGSTSLGGRLEGVIVSGWRIGEHVRVAFDTVSSCTDRDGVAHGPCFVGAIRVGWPPEK
jgi:hypothetical protein